MTSLITIDPGATSGWACFEGETLVACGKHQGALVLPTLPLRGGVSAIIEKPMVYPGEKTDPQDLVTLAIRVGEWKQYIFHKYDSVAELVVPPTWKGSVPKEIHNRRTLSVLTESEQGRLPKTKSGKPDHNMLDAVGLGLWKLGRSVR
jgi:hypothetical protein